MFTIKQILKVTDGRLIWGSAASRVSGIGLDSRSLKAGELFIAIAGQRLDGHKFVNQAIRLGAKAVLFSNSAYLISSYPKQTSLIKVESTRAALAKLARNYRARFKIPIVAITGSNGKTTTKEMLKEILAKRYNVLANPGTENNLIGVAKALFNLRKSHNLAVLEIGTNHFGEIDRLSWILKPEVGVMINIGPSHLEFFKTTKGVFKAKCELIKNLAKDARLILNKDDRYLCRLRGRNFKTVRFGLNGCCEFWAENVEQTERGISFLLNGRHRIALKVLGRHNVYNALASIAAARCFGIGFNQIKDALASFKAPPMRMQMLKISNIKVIVDCYNANPESLECALDFLSAHPGEGRRIVVCGDMLELGKTAKRFHLNLGKRLAGEGVDFLITVGPLAKNLASGARLAGMSRKSIRRFPNSLAAGRFLRQLLKPPDTVLIKGSRGMKMENALKCFTNFSTH